MDTRCRTVVGLLVVVLLTCQTLGNAQKIGSSAGTENERLLPSRCPQTTEWAGGEELPESQVIGQGAISAEGERIGQGVRPLLENNPGITTRKKEDKATTEVKGDTVTYTFSSPSGIGGATIAPSNGWPKRIVLRLNLKGLESLAVSNGRIELHVSVLSHSGNPRLLDVKDGAREKKVERGSPYWTDIQAFDAKGEPIPGLPEKGGYFEMVLPQGLFEAKPKSLVIEWIDFYRD